LNALRSSDVSLGMAALQAMTVHRERNFAAELREVAQEVNRPTAFRVAALQLAAGGDKPMDTASFEMLIQPFISGGAPEARLQSASVLGGAKLNREQSLRLAEILPLAGPVEMSRLLGAFQRGPADRELGAVLLAKITSSPARWGVHGQDVQVLFRRFPTPIQDDAAPMIAEIMNQTAAKDARVIELEKVAARGDAARGRVAFLAGAGACVSCHQVGEAGGKIGPNLSKIGGIRTTRDLVEAIAFPNATIARGYETFQITRSDGSSLTGTIPTETAETLMVALADGRETPVPRASVVKMEPVATSLMPAGLDRAIEPEVFADLIAYLKSLQ